MLKSSSLDEFNQALSTQKKIIFVIFESEVRLETLNPIAAHFNDECVFKPEDIESIFKKLDKVIYLLKIY